MYFEAGAWERENEKGRGVSTDQLRLKSSKERGEPSSVRSGLSLIHATRSLRNSAGLGNPRRKVSPAEICASAVTRQHEPGPGVLGDVARDRADAAVSEGDIDHRMRRLGGPGLAGRQGRTHLEQEGVRQSVVIAIGALGMRPPVLVTFNIAETRRDPEIVVACGIKRDSCCAFTEGVGLGEHHRVREPVGDRGEETAGDQ